MAVIDIPYKRFVNQSQGRAEGAPASAQFGSDALGVALYAGALDYAFSLNDRWQLFAGIQHAASTGGVGLVSLEQGTTFALRPNVSLEAGFVELGLNAGAASLQFQASLIVNWGRVF